MNLATVTTAPWDPDEPHRRLAGLGGRWAGRGRLWLDPAGRPDEAAVEAEGTLLLGGRFLQLAYRSTAGGQPHAGEFVLGWDQNERRWTAAWIDSFHNGTAVMHCLGTPGDPGVASVLGSYRAGEERWGWRTTFLPEGRDRLVIEMTNLSPTGPEDRAVEMVLDRVP